MIVWLSSNLWRELKDNNLKKSKKEFSMKELKSQPIFCIISTSFTFISRIIILKSLFKLLLLLTLIAYT